MFLWTADQKQECQYKPSIALYQTLSCLFVLVYFCLFVLFCFFNVTCFWEPLNRTGTTSTWDKLVS